MDKKLVVAVDFDGTIVNDKFPEIGNIKTKTVELMKKLKEKGHLVIVWTCRSGHNLDDAVDFLNKNNILYDYINENPQDPYAIAGWQGRKVFCDIYLDDRAVNIKDIDEVFKIIE